MGDVYVLIRTDVEKRREGATVVSRDVKGIFADPFIARQQIPEWAINERANLNDKELYAVGYADVEFVVEKWAVTN